MNKRQYFIEAMQAGVYRNKDWVLCVFTVTREPPELPDYPYRIKHKPDSDQLFFIDPNSDNALQAIDESSKKAPLFTPHEKIKLDISDLVNVDRPVDTTYGNALLNALMFIYPFGAKIPFMTGKLDPGKIENLVADMLTDGLSTENEPNNSVIYTDEYVRFCAGIGSIGGFTQINCASGSIHTVTIAPEILARRDELIKEAGAKISDTAVLAKIESELSAMDKASHKGTSAEGFYLSGSRYDVNRKKSLIMMGLEASITGTTEGIDPILTSLVDGINVEQLPQMVDNLRAGSYNRGKMTALGGESVKYFYRIFQNTKIAELDCGTEAGLEWRVTPTNHRQFVGLYRVPIPSNGKALQALQDEFKFQPITEDWAKANIGNKILVRSPITCKTADSSFCHRCSGDKLSENPNSLHTSISDIGSSFMLCLMKAMHGKALRTVKYNFKERIT